jgi:excisionase family DNA binding protein
VRADTAVPFDAAEQLLTLEQAARRLGCSVRTVSRRVERGELVAFRDRRLVRVRVSDLRAYVTAHAAAPPSRCAPRPISTARQRAPVANLFDLADPLR